MRVSIKDLKKVYSNGTTALQGCSLEIEPGMFGLLGPNGAGKTTLLRILATLLPPTSGGALIGDLDVVRDKQRIRQKLGYLPQEFGVYPTLTVAEYLDYMALLSGLKSADRRRAVSRAMELVHLQDKSKTKARALSGGMKRRLGIAQAILHDPEVLIVDEPTAGLDPEERVRFRNLLAELAEERVVILSTHIVEDIATTCPRVAVLHQGSILHDGTPNQLLLKAQNKVWLLEAGQAELPHIRRQLQVITVTHQTAGALVKIMAEEQPLPGAYPAEPTLEDAYMALMGGSNR